MAFSSSRTLPGQGYSHSAAMASFEMPFTTAVPLANRFRK